MYPTFNIWTVSCAMEYNSTKHSNRTVREGGVNYERSTVDRGMLRPGIDIRRKRLQRGKRCCGRRDEPGHLERAFFTPAEGGCERPAGGWRHGSPLGGATGRFGDGRPLDSGGRQR